MKSTPAKCVFTTFACALAATMATADMALAQAVSPGADETAGLQILRSLPANVEQAVAREAIQKSTGRAIIVLNAAAGPRPESNQDPTLILRSLGPEIRPLGGNSMAAVAQLSVPDMVRLGNDVRIKRIYYDRPLRHKLSETANLMGAVPAWAAGAEGSGTAVAILDTGVQTDHPFLRGRVVAEACFSSTIPERSSKTTCPNGQNEMIGAGAGRPCDAEGCDHGTHVAGIAAGFDGRRDASSPRLDGVARRAGIVAMQIFSILSTEDACDGEPAPCTTSYTSDILRALLHVKKLVEVDKIPIAAVNMSLGGGRFETYCDDQSPLTEVISELTAMNVSVIAAAGNENYTNALDTPACIRAVISVGSVRKDGQVAADYSNSAPMLSLLAPGSGVFSSVLNGGFASMNGTSMATPQVAGAIALLRGAVPNATHPAIIDALTRSGTSVTDPRNNLAKIMVNVDKALALLKGAGPGAALACPAAADVAAVQAAAARGTQADAATQDKIRRAFGAESAVVRLPDGSLLVAPRGTVAAAPPACPDAAPAAARPPDGVAPAARPPAAPPSGLPNPSDRIIIR